MQSRWDLSVNLDALEKRSVQSDALNLGPVRTGGNTSCSPVFKTTYRANGPAFCRPSGERRIMAIALSEQAETRVTLIDGIVQIRQPDENDPDGRDDVVCIAVENIPTFIAHLRELATSKPGA